MVTNTYVYEQVFFRAGVLGQMEELRDDRLSKIVSWLQAYIRGYLSRKEFKKLQEQRWDISWYDVIKTFRIWEFLYPGFLWFLSYLYLVVF